MLARLGMFWPLPGWAIVKIVIWLIFGGMTAFIYKGPEFTPPTESRQGDGRGTDAFLQVLQARVAIVGVKRMAEIGTGSVQANGITFHYLEIGQGPLVLCMHGFPDHAHTYRALLPALAAAGLHAVAPFMRGYAPTACSANGI